MEAVEMTLPFSSPCPSSPALEGNTEREADHLANIQKLQEIDDDSTYWSNTGEKYDASCESLSLSTQSSLLSTSVLGTGAFGNVYRVICRQIPMAKKSIRTSSEAQLDAVKAEVRAGQRLNGHTHIVQLVGTYITEHHGESMLHILSFPVADRDLERFLTDY